MGASTPSVGLGMRHAAHPVPDGNAVAWILLPGGSSEAGRQRLALLHPVSLRPGLREVGAGEGSGVSHRRLITGLLGTLCLPCHERRAPPASPVCKGHPFRDILISGRIAVSQLVPPHNSEEVKPLLLLETERAEERKRAE